MNRRDLIKQIALLTGGVVIGGEVFLSGCKSGTGTEVGFTASNLALLDEIGEGILPATSTPGAKAAKIAEFMKVIVNDCYEASEQKIFTDGIGKFQDACKKAKGKSYMDCSAEERHDFLVTLDKEAKEHQKRKSELEKQDKEIKQKEQTDKQATDVSDERKTHYFTMMKQLTLWGYFTSKEGVTNALNYQPVPGKFVGVTDYKKGDKALANLDG